MMLMIIMNIMFDGMRLLGATKCVYMALSVIMVPALLLLHLLLFMVVGFVMVNLLGAYVRYWLICTSILRVRISVYCLFDSKLV